LTLGSGGVYFEVPFGGSDLGSGFEGLFRALLEVHLDPFRGPFQKLAPRVWCSINSSIIVYISSDLGGINRGLVFAS